MQPPPRRSTASMRLFDCLGGGPGQSRVGRARTYGSGSMLRNLGALEPVDRGRPRRPGQPCSAPHESVFRIGIQQETVFGPRWLRLLGTHQANQSYSWAKKAARKRLFRWVETAVCRKDPSCHHLSERQHPKTCIRMVGVIRLKRVWACRTLVSVPGRRELLDTALAVWGKRNKLGDAHGSSVN